MATSILNNLIVSGSLATPFRSTTTSTTATVNDYTINCVNGALAVTVTLPTPVGSAGRIYVVKRGLGSAGLVTIATAARSVQNLIGTFTTTTTLAALGVYGQNVGFQSDGINWHRIS